MNCVELKHSIGKAPIASRAALEKVYMQVTAGDSIRPEFAEYLEAASTYNDFIEAIYRDENRKFSLLWAECAKL